jgi:hypothetical protein
MGDAVTSAGRAVPVLGLIEGRIQAWVNPFADLDVDLGDDDQMD